MINVMSETRGRIMDLSVNRADVIARVIARTVDIFIVIVFRELIPHAGFFAGIIYLLIADGLFYGRSAGKKLTGLKVVVSHGNATTVPCSFKESMVRNSPFAGAYLLYGIFSAIPLVGWLVGIIIVIAVLIFEGLVMLGSDEGMRFGDELANTRVTEERQEE